MNEDILLQIFLMSLVGMVRRFIDTYSSQHQGDIDLGRRGVGGFDVHLLNIVLGCSCSFRASERLWESGRCFCNLYLDLWGF